MNNQNVNTNVNGNVVQPGVVPQQQVVPQQVLPQQTVPKQNVQQVGQTNGNKPVKQKKKSKVGVLFTLLIILGLAGGVYYFYDQNVKLKDYYEHNYSQLTSKEEKDLPLDSFIVNDLYNRFKTSAKEDYFEKDFNSNMMKLYFGIRNVSSKDYVESNCNLFNNTRMKYVVCKDDEYTPVAIDEDILKMKLIELYGENNGIQLNNIQLGNSCYGGFQYIADREQFVKGHCNSSVIALIDATKELYKATTKENEIKIYEKVRYFTSATDVPDYLRSGKYVYTFRLDPNYNYILESKTFIEGKN